MWKQCSLMYTIIVLTVLDYVKQISYDKHIMKYVHFAHQSGFSCGREEKKNPQAF